LSNYHLYKILIFRIEDTKPQKIVNFNNKMNKNTFLEIKAKIQFILVKTTNLNLMKITKQNKMKGS
jgi:hypothetical protein